jgi:hypothetical protein
MNDNTSKQRYTLPDSLERGIVYGPAADLEDGYVLTLTTADAGTVEIEVPEQTMYQLWTEVQGTPWPDTTDDQEEAAQLRRRLVDLARGADAEMLRDALDALDDRPSGERN